MEVSHKICRRPVYLGSSGVNLRRVEGSHRVQASDRGWAGALPRGAKRSKKVGQLSYARVRTIQRVRSPKKNFTDIQRAIGRLLDELPEEGFTPRLVDSYWAKGAAIMVCHDEVTKDWLASRVSTLMAIEGPRLKLVGLDAIPTYKRVVAWLPGPAMDAERYLLRLRRLNQGLDTRHWRVYERREESNGVRLVLRIDAACQCVGEVEMEALQWCGAGHNFPSGRQVGGKK